MSPKPYNDLMSISTEPDCNPYSSLSKNLWIAIQLAQIVATIFHIIKPNEGYQERKAFWKWGTKLLEQIMRGIYFWSRLTYKFTTLHNIDVAKAREEKRLKNMSELELLQFEYDNYNSNNNNDTSNSKNQFYLDMESDINATYFMIPILVIVVLLTIDILSHGGENVNIFVFFFKSAKFVSNILFFCLKQCLKQFCILYGVIFAAQDKFIDNINLEN